jgi:hypothetical protein
MQKSNIEYIEMFFKHFDIDTKSIRDVSSARDEFYSRYGIKISICEIYKGFKYSSKVFNIENVTTFKKVWYADFNVFLSNIAKHKESTLILAMPRNRTWHDIILRNNKYRTEMKKILGFYPEVRFSPYETQHVIKFGVSGFKVMPELVRQVATILNRFEEPADVHWITMLKGNENYKIDMTPTRTSFHLYGKVKDLNILLTSLRFAGIKIEGKVEILTTEETYDRIDPE